MRDIIEYAPIFLRIIPNKRRFGKKIKELFK